ncbi:MAG: VWA domain-containing protein [Azonexus sp.]|jgi:hypothetical protein|nr:VWA domain-containing protein [Azonexus sp.]
MQPRIQTYWHELDCGFQPVAEVFEECALAALAALDPTRFTAYLDAACILGKLGRGPEPMLAFLEGWPQVAAVIKDDPLPPVMDFIRAMQKSPNGPAIAPFLQTLPAVARCQPTLALLQDYLDIARDLMTRTTGSVHGLQQTIASPGLPEFFTQVPQLLDLLSLEGLRRWTEYGIRNHGNHPERQVEYFRLAAADSRAVMQRERHGTLFHDVERRLDLYLRALWSEQEILVPYSTAFDAIRQPVPYDDKQGMRVPDVIDDSNGISGLDRYRAILAHMAGHRRWSTPLIADNWSPFQRMAVEFFEDARIDLLLMREYPGLRRVFLALHPRPEEDACDPETTSTLRFRLAMISRAILDPGHGYRDPALNETVARFHALLAAGPASTAALAELALAYVARTRRQSDQFAKIHFADTVVSYRDDNRQLWRFIEQGDEEEAFDEPRQSQRAAEPAGLPPRHYPEWDYQTQTYRPDWVSLYEALHPAGEPLKIDRLLAKHAALAKRLKRLLDLLKPQDKVRIRYQEEGAELDLDIALRALIDFKSGAQPDPRINMSHQTAGRDIAVLLLLDLSESLNEKTPAGDQSILELSQEAVSLLAWAIDRLGDPLAIAGFHSDTRHQVRYQHIKGFSESWNDEVKARLAAMEAGWSTRMGAALRHAGHYLGARQADKKLLLVLTDGRPSDVDVSDERALSEDARRAVRELAQQDVVPYCISLDPQADEYVADIFGRRYSVIDNIQRLPEKLSELFIALTK